SLWRWAVRQASVSSGVREVFTCGDLWVGIRLEQIKLSFFCQSIVQTRITAEKKVTINSFGEPFECLVLLGREFGRTSLYADFFLIRRIPLNLERGNILGAFRELFHHQFPGRIGLDVLVTDYAYINLASLYIL